MTFLEEVLEYNKTLRQEGFTIAIGGQHGNVKLPEKQHILHFVYTFGEEQHEIAIISEPTDYTEWNNLQEWVGAIVNV